MIKLELLQREWMKIGLFALFLSAVSLASVFLYNPESEAPSASSLLVILDVQNMT